MKYRTKYSFSATEGPSHDDDDPASDRPSFRDTAKLPLARGDTDKSDPPSKAEPGADEPEGASRSSLLAKAAPGAASEDVAVPIDGLPPRTVGAIIMAGVTLIIVMGFYLLR